VTREDDDLPGLPSLRQEVEHFFGEVLGARPARRAPLEFWNPKLDLLEEEDRFVVLVDVPGVSEEDLGVELEGPRLAVTGRREFVRESGGRGLRHRERYSGSFRRTVVLPAPVDRARVTAVLRAGVLRVEVPKRVAGR
jgi:HSP20 family protein